MKRLVLAFGLALLLANNGFAQRVGINTANPDASAALDVTATNAGALMPRMTEAQRVAITAPATGLLVYQTDAPSGFYYFDGTSWLRLSTGSSRLPAEVELAAANFVDYYLTDEGLEVTLRNTERLDDAATPTTFAQTQTQYRFPVVGSFEGSGTGNKAFVGINAYDGTNPENIAEMTIVARRLSAGFGNQFYVNLQVDCNGNGVWDNATTDALLVVSSANIPAMNLGTSFTPITLDFNANIFRSIGGAFGFPPHTGSGGAPITQLTAGGCATPVLLNSISTDGGTPNNTNIPGILLISGDSGTRVFSRIRIQSVTIDGADIQF